VTDATKVAADRDALVGRATGAMVMALFGLLWALGCGAVPGGMPVPLLFASSAVVTAVLVVAGLRLRRASLTRGTRSSRRHASPANADRTRRRFRLVGILEGLGIGIVVLVCVRLGRPELIPSAVALVVGLHFLPLATLFRVPLYHATGAALCLVTVATPLVAAPMGAQTVAWQVVPGLGAAVILWATSAVLVVGGLESILRGV